MFVRPPVLGGANSAKADPVIVKTPVLLTGGKFSECFVPGTGTYFIQMQGWQNIVAYENTDGISFDENSYMQFDLEETVNEGGVRVEFTFSDGSTQTEWWCLGIGETADDTSKPYGHAFDESKYWMKKGLGENFDSKKDLKITKVKVRNWGTENVVTYKINGGTMCGQPMTIKQDNAKVFGAYGGEFTATAAQSNIFQMKNFEVGDYEKVVIEFDEAVPATGNWAYNYQSGVWPSNIPVGATKLEITLDGNNLPELTIFNWDANPHPIKIKEVYLYKEVKNIEATPVFEAPAGTTDLNDLTGTNTSWSVKYPQTLSEATVFCGDGHGDATVEDTHVTITGKDYLCFEVTNVEGSGQQLRVWIWDGEAGGTGSTKTLYAYPIADYETATWTTSYTISATGTYVVKVSDYQYLKGVKTNWGGAANTITISSAYACTGATPTPYLPSYILSGASNIAASASAALSDANAVYYDATGVLGTGVTLTPTNPNAMIKANDGVLTNTNNVIVNDVCANLVLTDGYPFKAPANFTATTASYATTINTTAQAGTLCLPFAASIPEGVKAYTLSYTSGDEATATAVDGPIPANTPVLLNGSGSASFTGANVAVSASATNRNGAMTGVFERTAVPENSYVLQNGEEGLGFYKVASSDIFVNPFRAYLTAEASSANLRIVYDDATAIDEVKTQTAGDDAIYTLTGIRVAQPTKGIYVKNGRKFIVK